MNKNFFPKNVLKKKITRKHIFKSHFENLLFNIKDTLHLR